MIRRRVSAPSDPGSPADPKRIPPLQVPRTATTPPPTRPRRAPPAPSGPVPTPSAPTPAPAQLDAQRHHRHVPQPFELEVDQAQRLVHPDTDGRAARQHRRDHRPRLPQRRRQQYVGHADAERISRIRKVALRVDQRRSPRCRRRTPPPAPPAAAATSGPHRRPSASRSHSIGARRSRRPRCAETARCAGRSSNPSAAQDVSAPARPTMCTGSTPHTAGPSRTCRR